MGGVWGHDEPPWGQGGHRAPRSWDKDGDVGLWVDAALWVVVFGVGVWGSGWAVMFYGGGAPTGSLAGRLGAVHRAGVEGVEPRLQERNRHGGRQPSQAFTQRRALPAGWGAEMGRGTGGSTELTPHK